MHSRHNLLHADLSEQVIGASIVVLNTLGPGLDEKIYERALVIELTERRIPVDTQHKFPVYFKDNLVGALIPDLIVDERIVVDTKVVEVFHDNHIAKNLAHLAITGLELGLLVNFKYARLQWKRVIRQKAVEEQITTADDADKRG